MTNSSLQIEEDSFGAPAKVGAAVELLKGRFPADQLQDEPGLVERAKARDAAAWSALFDRYHGFVFRYIYGRMRDRDEAEDLASQVFLEALKGIGSYRDRGKPLLAWFYGIARNLVAMRLRRLGIAGRSAVVVESTTEFEASAVDSLVLRAAIEGLTKDQREVIALRFLADLPTPMIAATLGKKEATIYALQVRGIAALRRQLQRE